MLDQLKNQLQEFSWIIRGLRQGEYPEFVVRAVAPATIPVFSYHRILGDEFEAQLKYLKDNGYRTLTTDEYYENYRQNQAREAKAVVLTFDDGMDDLYTVAYPLLKKYQFTAVAFVMASWIGRPGMITWEQANKMHQAGVMDFQSHSLYHAAFSVNPKVIDFYHPGYQSFQNWNVPVSDSRPLEQNSELPVLGTPIYEFASRLSDKPRFFPPQAVIEKCQQFVRDHGGSAFFQQKKWRQQLNNYHARIYPDHANEACNEAGEVQQKAILEDLTQSRELLEQNIKDKQVRHISFPWNQSGQISKSYLTQAGYLSGYGGLSKEYHSNGEAINIFYINRVSGDYIFALPGQGRQSMGAIMFSKIRRRLSKGAMY